MIDKAEQVLGHKYALLVESNERLAAELSDSRDHVDFLKGDVRRLLGMLGKKRTKKNADAIAEIIADLEGAA